MTKPPDKPVAATKNLAQKNEQPLLVAAWREMQGWGSKGNTDGTQNVEPFDLYDLPVGMHADGLAVSEAFVKRWLNGRAFTAYIKDPNTGVLVEGRYDKDMIDSDTVKLSWLLGYERIKAKYDDLIVRVDNSKAIDELRKRFEGFIANNPTFRGPLDTLQHCHNDLQDLHAAFQFQLSHVDTLDGLVEAKWSHLGQYLKNFGMSDVTASLGSFYFYAAVAKANIRQETYNKYNTSTGTQQCRRARVEVTHIYAYAKDSYSFNDIGPSSQYLGHWNRTGMVILPSAATVSLSASNQKHMKLEAGNETTPPFPVDLLGKLLGKDIYYPLRNRDFLKWREKKGRGGDFLVSSNRDLIKLRNPISLDMGEVCN